MKKRSEKSVIFEWLEPRKVSPRASGSMILMFCPTPEKLSFGVVLVPPFRAFGVSYRRKHCLERCLNFVHFLHGLLCHFRPPKWPPNHVKWRSIFGTIFYRSADLPPGMIAVPSPPGTPLSFNSSITQRPLRFAALPVTWSSVVLEFCSLFTQTFMPF